MGLSSANELVAELGAWCFVSGPVVGVDGRRTALVTKPRLTVLRGEEGVDRGPIPDSEHSSLDEMEAGTQQPQERTRREVSGAALHARHHACDFFFDEFESFLLKPYVVGTS